MLRKFFQMVFVGSDRKSLHIYTASVIGGCNEEKLNSETTNLCSTQYVSHLDVLKDFRMKFEFVVLGNDNNDVVSIESENITDGDKGFLSQIAYIRQVWGDKCEVIQDDQRRLDQALREYLPYTTDFQSNPAKSQSAMPKQEVPDDNLNKWGITSSQTASLASRKILYIGDMRKKSEGEMFGLAIAGEFEQKSYNRPLRYAERNKVLEGNESAFYCIQVPHDVELIPGIELVNWVKTTISFRHRFHDSNLNFCIQKKEKSVSGVKYIAPDFTWYFSPPVKAFINNESSSVEIKFIADPIGTIQECRYKNELCKCNPDSDKELYKCICPIKKAEILDHTTTRHPNVINPVANKTTVNFKQWTKDEMISYRQKYRLAVKNIFTKNITFSNTNEINIYLDTADEHGRGNRQFVLGLFISFALSFGIDSSRLQYAAPYFPLPQFLDADAWLLILLVLLSLNVLIRPPRAKREQAFYIWRRFNVISTLMWIACVFIIFRSRILLDFCHLWILDIQNVVGIIYFIPAISDCIYMFFNIIKYRDPILSGLFHDDIL